MHPPTPLPHSMSMHAPLPACRYDEARAKAKAPVYDDSDDESGSNPFSSKK